MLVKIGTRGSRLALWQAHHVRELLEKGGLQAEIIPIETKGDKIQDRALSKIGSKGLFTEELEEQLRSGTIDIAVHSAKDVQSVLDEDLELIAFTEREEVNDVVISLKGETLLESGVPFVVGTSSTRRVSFLRHYYPHLGITDMRGNLQTRLKKLEEGHCDALILAYAGVHRMAYDDLIAQKIATDIFTPAVGQGSIAVECAVTLDAGKRARIRQLVNHDPTSLCLCAERAYLREMQGGCSIPVFGLATLHPAHGLSLEAGVVSLDGRQLIREKGTAGEITPAAAENLGKALAESVLAKGGGEILAAIRQQRGS